VAEMPARRWCLCLADGLLENGRASGIHDHELFGTGRRWSFHDGRYKITITLLIRKACEIQTDIAGNGSGAVMTETGGVIGIPVRRSPGANDHPNRGCSRG